MTPPLFHHLRRRGARMCPFFLLSLAGAVLASGEPVPIDLSNEKTTLRVGPDFNGPGDALTSPPPRHQRTAGVHTVALPTVQLRLRTGGSLEGDILDYDDHGLIILHSDTAYVFGWVEVEARSACVARRIAVTAARGGAHRLDAEDYHQLGVFELSRHRKDFASDSFKEAARLDPSYHEKNRRVIEAYRERLKAGSVHDAFESDGHDESESPDSPAHPNPRDPSTSAPLDIITPLAPQPSPENREKILEVYRAFGDKVRERVDARMVLIETEHFLIWTDWEERERDRLADWCERMFEALRRQLKIPPDEPVFLAKCPVFCFRSTSAFHRFAQDFDGYDVRDAIGYTRSIAANGHVHMAILRQGQKPHDFDRFACTLTHEGTHAFLHRLYSTALIPHWINEGYAELIAAQVMGDRCPNDGNASLLSRQYVARNWPIGDFLRGVGPIAVHDYALAHSLVRFLNAQGADRWSGFVRSLKDGRSVADALHVNYDGLSLDQLEERWREHVAQSTRAATRGTPPSHPANPTP